MHLCDLLHSLGLLANETILSCNGKLLRDDRRLCDYNVQDGSTVFVLLTLSGGNPDDVEVESGT